MNYYKGYTISNLFKSNMPRQLNFKDIVRGGHSSNLDPEPSLTSTIVTS